MFPMFCPVHAFGYQFNSRGINSPDGPLEAPRQPEITSPSLSKKTSDVSAGNAREFSRKASLSARYPVCDWHVTKCCDVVQLHSEYR